MYRISVFLISAGYFVAAAFNACSLACFTVKWAMEGDFQNVSIKMVGSLAMFMLFAASGFWAAREWMTDKERMGNERQ